MKYKAILFDFDGTIADTAPGIVHTMCVTFAHLGMPIPDEAAMRATIGLPLSKALQQANHLSDADAALAADTYRQFFKSCEAGLITLFPQVKETLQQLREMGMRMAIVTSRNVESLQLVLSTHHIADYFEILVTNNDGLPHKPAPDMVLHLLNRMEISADQTLVVGDTTFDILMGNGAKCHTCAVTYGNHTRPMLLTAQPTYMIDSFNEILSLIS